MKLNIDLNYILKRIIVIILAFIIISQLKSCDVFAMNQRISPNACYMYYNTGTTNRSGTVYNSILSGNAPVYYCSVSVSTNYASTRYDFLSDNIGSGIGSMVFYVADTHQLNAVSVLTSNREYTCELNSSFQLSDVTNNMAYYYSVVCPNVPFNSNSTYQVKIVKFDTPSTQTGSYLSRDINFTLNDSSTISEAINNQGSQAHSDSQAINNSINDGSIDTGTNNGGGVFNVDSDGQSTVIPTNNFGLAGIVTAPLVILNRAKEACTPKSFTMFQKTITLPCGDALFWNRDFSSQASIFTKGQTGSGLNTTRNTFRDFWNILFGGAIIFHLLTKLWDVIQRAIDPMDNGYETISSAIDTGPDVTRDTDGDKDDPMNDLRDSATVRMSEEKDRRLHHLKGRRA